MPTATETKILELEKSLKGLLDENDGLARDWKDEDGKGHYVITTEQRDKFRKNRKQIEEVQGLIEDCKGTKKGQDYLAGVDGSSVAVQAAAMEMMQKMGGPVFGGGANAYKSLGERFTDSEEFKEFKASGQFTMKGDWKLNQRDMGGEAGKGIRAQGQKDIFTYMPTGPSIAPHFGQTQFDPLVVQAFRRTRVRDLFPVQTTSANLIEFFRVSGYQNAASTVPERVGSLFGTKPQSTLDITAALAPVQTIAHWEVAHRNVLMDEPQLQGLINNELLYGLRLEEDFQILQGSGNSPDLLGIMNTPGIQGYVGLRSGANALDNKADDIRRAATKAILAYYEPTGIVMHPYDWEATELIKDSLGRYIVAGAVSIGAEKTLWQMPVVDTPAMNQGQALVGAFGLGAQLYDRELGNIRIAEQHAGLFIQNAVLILAEQRITVACKRPESFIAVTLGA